MIALLLLAGLILLVLGGELLVRGAAKLATSVGISPLVVGLTVVAFGTSAPELAVAVQAAWAGEVDIALGNVVGSNILNVLLILGISALITPLLVASQMIRQEVPVMIGVSILLLLLALDGQISRLEGGLFFALAVSYTILLIRQSRRETKATREQYEQQSHLQAKSWDDRLPVQIGLILIGLAMLVFGAGFLIDGATQIAAALGVSELIIGLTIVAGGTSLPEVAASIAAALKGQRDMAVGSVVGSNIFNILVVLGLSSLASPAGLTVSQTLLEFDMIVMLAVAVACLPVFFTGATIARWEGAVFLGYYVAYTSYLVLGAQQSALVDEFSLVMLGFVLPLTVLTLAVVSYRAWKLERSGLLK